MKGEALVCVSQSAGSGIDLLLAASLLFGGEKKTKTDRLLAVEAYLKDALTPDMRLAALFLPKGDAYFLFSEFAGLLFSYDPIPKMLRLLNQEPEKRFLRLLAFHAGSADPIITASLEELGRDNRLIVTEAIPFLQKLADRINVVHQTCREDITVARQTAEEKPVYWNEAGLTKVLENAEEMPRQEKTVWQTAISLVGEDRFWFLGEDAGAQYLLVGVECAKKLPLLLEEEERVAPEVELLPLLSALADPHRLEILRLLQREDLYVAALCEKTGLPQPKLLYHLQTLKEAGLVEGSRMGRRVYYSYLPQKVEKCVRLLETQFCQTKSQNREELS